MARKRPQEQNPDDVATEPAAPAREVAPKAAPKGAKKGSAGGKGSGG